MWDEIKLRYNPMLLTGHHKLSLLLLGQGLGFSQGNIYGRFLSCCIYDNLVLTSVVSILVLK